MGEFKITVELSDKAYEVLSKLTSSLDNLLANQILQEGNFQEFAEAEPKKTTKKAEVPEEKPTETKTEAVDFEKLRAEIRMLASSKKVAGKDVKAVLKAFGGKLSEVSDDKLEALRDEMAAL